MQFAIFSHVFQRRGTMKRTTFCFSQKDALLAFLALLASFITETCAIGFPVQFKNHQGQIQVVDPVYGGCDGQIKLLILIPSRPEMFSVRDEIRRTWTANLPRSVRRMFLVGTPSDDSLMGKSRNQIMAELEQEKRQNGDMLIVDVIDMYGRNVSLKLFAAYRWIVQFCGNVPFVLKIDDDSVADANRLLFWIKKKFNKKANKAPGRKAIFGRLLTGDAPIRDPGHRWFQPADEFPDGMYPPYINGPIILFTIEALRALLDQAPSFNIMRMEDALFTGVLAQAAGVRRYHYENHFRITSNINKQERCGYLKGRPGVPQLIAKNFGIAKNFAEKWFWLEDVRCT